MKLNCRSATIAAPTRPYDNGVVHCSDVALTNDAGVSTASSSVPNTQRCNVASVERAPATVNVSRVPPDFGPDTGLTAAVRSEFSKRNITMLAL